MSEYAASPGYKRWLDDLRLSDSRQKSAHNLLKHIIAPTVRRADNTRHAAKSCIEKIEALYINLGQELDRLRFIEEQLARVGVVGQRIEAVDGHKPLPTDLASYFNPKHVMDAGALGCYASHIRAWQQIILQRLPCALVLEDDAILEFDLANILRNILAALPHDWDMVHLATDADRAVLPIAELGEHHTLVRYSRVPPGTVGYLISAAGAQKMLTAETRIWPLDTDTRRPWIFRLNVFGMTPPPIRHNWRLPSTIRARGPKRRTPRRGIRAAIYNPIRNSESFCFNFGRLGPSWWWRCLIINGLWKCGALLRPVLETWRHRRRVLVLRVLR